jgi:hypothetical protein
MGILDDAIREHLDLKRKHGARDAELREIEDEALGSGDQPDPFSSNELFNEVSAPGAAEAPAGGEDPTRLVEPEGLRPATEIPTETPPPDLSEPLSPPEGIEPLPGQTELPGSEEVPGQERLDDPLEGLGAPATESHEPAAPEPTAEPPATSESLEDLIAEEEPFPEDAGSPGHELPVDDDLPLDPEAPETSEEVEVIEAEVIEPEPEEPESSVPEPPPPPPENEMDTGPEPPGRARGRIDVPTQEHPPPGETGGLPPLPESRPEPFDEAAEEPFEDEPAGDEPGADAGAPALYDFETDEDPISNDVPAGTVDDDDFDALGPAEEEAPYLEDEEPYAEEPVSDTGSAPPAEEPGTEVRPALEDEEAYEGGGLDPEEEYEEEEGEEGLWFEKGPPKDFDFE